MFIVLPCCKMSINLYSSVQIKDGKYKLLKKALTNNRYDRPRPEATDKGSAANFVLKVAEGEAGEKKKKLSFAEESGAYGFKWAKKYKG